MTNVLSVIFDLFNGNVCVHAYVCRQCPCVCIHRRVQICERVERDWKKKQRAEQSLQRVSLVIKEERSICTTDHTYAKSIEWLQ